VERETTAGDKAGTLFWLIFAIAAKNSWRRSDLWPGLPLKSRNPLHRHGAARGVSAPLNAFDRAGGCPRRFLKHKGEQFSEPRSPGL